MKYFSFLTLLCIFFVFENGYCQKEDYLTGTPLIDVLEVYNNYLVFSYSEDSTGYIAFSNLEAEEASYFTFKELDISVSDFTIVDDFLYFVSSEIDEVSRLDLTNPDLDPVRIIDGLQNPTHIAISNSSMFLAIKTNNWAYNWNNNDIFYQRLIKFDLDSLEQGPSILLDSVVVSAISDYGNGVMYSTNYPKRGLYLYNEESRLIGCTPGSASLNDFVIRGDEVYAHGSLVNGESPSSIVKFEILSDSGDFTVLDEGAMWPYKLAIHENYIYVFDLYFAGISRIKLEEVSDLAVVVNTNVIETYPNPISDLINIDGNENLAYNIYSINGTKVIDGNLNGDGQIDVTALPSGFYILHLEDGSISKFQKI